MTSSPLRSMGSGPGSRSISFPQEPRGVGGCVLLFEQMGGWRCREIELLSETKGNGGCGMQAQEDQSAGYAPRDNTTRELLLVNRVSGRCLAEMPCAWPSPLFGGGPGLVSSSSFQRGWFIHFPSGLSSTGLLLLTPYNPACLPLCLACKAGLSVSSFLVFSYSYFLHPKLGHKGFVLI